MRKGTCAGEGGPHGACGTGRVHAGAGRGAALASATRSAHLLGLRSVQPQRIDAAQHEGGARRAARAPLLSFDGLWSKAGQQIVYLPLLSIQAGQT